MHVNYGKPTRLRIILVTKGISQTQLSEMCGIDVYKISLICSGKVTNITLDTAKKIAYSIGVTLDEAFGDDLS